MNTMLKKIAAFFVIVFVVMVIVRDSKFHFNTDVIAIKRKHHSAQQHWNIGYSQKYVYTDSSFKYQKDFDSILQIIEPGYALVSDLATSYYAVAALPVYIRNIHKHHGGGSDGFSEFFNSSSLCYLEDAFHRKETGKFLKLDEMLSQKNDWPVLRYILLNKDKENTLLWEDCMPMRSQQLEVSLLEISKLLFDGTYLNLYQLEENKF